MIESSCNSWDATVRRVVIHTTDYLGFDGLGTAGGRQRFIRDMATVIRDHWNRDVLIFQKAHHDFNITCGYGFHVVGIKSNLTAKGDPVFAYRVKKLLAKNDGLLYASGEDAWPFFVQGAKAIQHGIWWDGPQSKLTKLIQSIRAITCMKAVKSMLCVDTNFINWLRGHGKVGLALANKCLYIPNYADIHAIAVSPVDKKGVIRLLCARRYEEKRGIDLFIDALGILNKIGIQFTGHISAPGGLTVVKSRLERDGLSSVVTVSEDSMDGVLSRYKVSDIAVVPTIWSEGTSLACVEALCAGVPVVATPVGGLGNLIIPGFNGFLVDPTGESIAKAIAKFSDPSLLSQMRTNCLTLRRALSLETWQSRILEWIKS